MTKSKRIVLFCLTSIVVLIFAYKYYDSNYTNEGILNNVIDKDGYSLSLETEEQKLISEGFYIKYNGYNLYAYSRLR